MISRLVFIDGRVGDYETLITGLPQGSAWFLLDPAQDGVKQMARIAANYHDLDAIDVISHGDVATLLIGATRLSDENLENYSGPLKQIGAALSDTGDLLLYGCKVGAGETGQAFVEALARATGTNIAASDDLTGATLLGGDWTLELSTGQIDVPALLDTESGIEGVLVSEIEPNDTKESATIVTLGTPVLGQLVSSTDADYFAVTATVTGGLALTFDVPTYSYSEYFKVSVYDLNGTLTARYQTGMDADYQVGAIAGQTYYVAISPGDSYNSGQYSLTIATAGSGSSYESESNGTMATADAVALGMPVLGQLMSSTDADYFAVTATVTGGLALTFDVPTYSYSEYFKVSVYDLNGTLTARYQTGMDADYQVGAIAGQTYYVAISPGDSYNSGQYSLTIATAVANSGNDTPLVAHGLQSQQATEDVAYRYSIPSSSFIDLDVDDTLTYTATKSDGTTLPSWLVFDASSQTFSGTPANADVGSVSITVTARDAANASASGTFSITVANTNDSPTLANANTDRVATEDSAFSFTVPSTTFSDVDVGDTRTYAVTLSGGGVLPNWLSFDATTRKLYGTPRNADVGTFDVTVTMADSAGASASDTFAITVANSNDAPALANAIADQSATEDQAWSFVVPADTFADVDVGDTLTYTATKSDGTALPSWLVFGASSQTFSGTPANADVGSVSVKVTAKDAANASASDTFSITVANTNDAPTLTSAIDNQSVFEDASFSFAIPSTTFSDIDIGDTLNYLVSLAGGGDLPAWLSFDASTLTFTGVPRKADTGEIVVRVTTTDDGGATASGDFTLTVTPDDVLGTSLTTAFLEINSSQSGSIPFSGDEDWYSINLAAGTFYQFDLIGVDGSGGTLSDPWLKLYNSNGTILRADDDGSSVYDDEEGHLHDSQIVFAPEESGTYFISATGFDGVQGSYTLTANTLSDDYYIQGILSQPNRRWNGDQALGAEVTVTYCFPVVMPADFGNADVVDYQPLTTQQQAVVRAVLSEIEELTLLDFVETEGNGDIRFAATYQTDSSGIAYSSYADSLLTQVDIALDHSAVGVDTLLPGSYMYMALIHEIGHALGLKHPGNYGAPAPYLPSSQDSTLYTIESYNNNTSGFLDVSPNAFLYLKTLMTFDIAALQYLYGVNDQVNVSDDSYCFDAEAMYAIWDASGFDRLDASAEVACVTLDLTQGGISYVGRVGTESLGTGLAPRFAIAYDTIIEGAIGGGADDILIGNLVGNTLFGLAGNDTIDAGTGNDFLDGGQGADTMIGGAGNDFYRVDHAGDSVIEVDGEGIDFVSARIDYTLPDHVENLLLNASVTFRGPRSGFFGGPKNVRIDLGIDGTGNAGDNLIIGNRASNELSGGGGADVLIGGAGADVFVFDVFDSSIDRIADFGAGDVIRIVGSGTVGYDASTGALSLAGVQFAVLNGWSGLVAPTWQQIA